MINAYDTLINVLYIVQYCTAIYKYWTANLYKIIQI
jgi:hypothetical protein